jgi:hypothetical protein
MAKKSQAFKMTTLLGIAIQLVGQAGSTKDLKSRRLSG